MPARREVLAGWVNELSTEQEEINDLLKHVIRHRARIREKLQLLEQLLQLEEDSARTRPSAPSSMQQSEEPAAPARRERAEASPAPRPAEGAPTPTPAPKRRAEPVAAGQKNGEEPAQREQSNGRRLSDILGDDPLDSEIEKAARELFGQF